MNILKLSWKNITSKPLPSILSMLLLAVGLSTAIILKLTEHQLTENINNTGKDVKLVIGAKGSRLQLVLSSVFQIDNPTGNITYGFYTLLKRNRMIKEMIPVSMGDSYKRKRIVGTNQDYVRLFSGKLKEGVLFEKPLEATIGIAVATELGLKVGDEFVGGHGMEEVLHSHDEYKYKVVGVLRRSGSVLDNLILTPVQTVWIMHAGHGDDSEYTLGAGDKSMHTPEEVVEDSLSQMAKEHNHEHHHHDHHDHVEVNLESVLANIDPKDREITAILFPNFSGNAKIGVLNNANNQPNMMAVDPAPEIMLLKNKLTPFVSIIIAISWFITIIAMFSVFIGLLNSLRGRKYEIALMRVLGASKAKVLVSILFEGVILSVLGYILCLVLSHAGMELIGNWMQNEYQYEFTGWIFLRSELTYLLVAIAIGLVSALFPAYKAYKTDISETLSK
ncbi:MAG: ABC transporter permease [Flavobacteriales bacterium]|nr:ABC transporter permease [Flavobacteriales bacterium]